ncbi:MAG: hypothetical protein CMJ88_04455 [Planctomycetes bacterium]|nr:hypothetical protein [Planctomycetota bacterium]
MNQTTALSLACWLTMFAPLLAQGERFAPPVMLQAGNKVAGKGRLYPSPVAYDFDHDGRIDVVIGDLRGYLTVARRRADNTFAAEERVQDVDGKRLDFNNW